LGTGAKEWNRTGGRESDRASELDGGEPSSNSSRFPEEIQGSDEREKKGKKNGMGKAMVLDYLRPGKEE